MEAKSEERGGLSNQSLIKLKRMLIRMGKVNLNLYLLVTEILIV
jgi:hypothetical protein